MNIGNAIEGEDPRVMQLHLETTHAMLAQLVANAGGEIAVDRIDPAITLGKVSLSFHQRDSPPGYGVRLEQEPDTPNM